MTSYHTRDSVEEEKNRCPIGQSFIYKSTFCGVRSQITTPIIPPDNISFILQAQPVTLSSKYLLGVLERQGPIPEIKISMHCGRMDQNDWQCAGSSTIHQAEVLLDPC